MSDSWPTEHSEEQALTEQERTAAIEAAESRRGVRQIGSLTDEDIRDRRIARGLRRKFAWAFFYILVGQLLVVYGIFVFVGLGFLDVEPRTLEILTGGTLAETFGIVLVIVRYLFSWV